jgi:hypothetical protein
MLIGKTNPDKHTKARKMPHKNPDTVESKSYLNQIDRWGNRPANTGSVCPFVHTWPVGSLEFAFTSPPPLGLALLLAPAEILWVLSF